MSMIESLKLPEGLKSLSKPELEKVSEEVRAKIIEVVSKRGGHLSTSLGAVDLTVALHSMFDSPKDKIIWDVGHQTYAHKILTGRLKEFETLRQRGGLSGFPKRGESPHDHFTVGHASTSISTALGVAQGRDLKGEKDHVVAVIGDGSLSGGLALEGINNLLHLPSNLIIILNDNEMSISKPVGAMSNYLTKVRTFPIYTGTKERIERIAKKIPKIGMPLYKSAEQFKNRVKHFLVDFKVGVIFEELGFKYLGPIDGHNIPLLMSTLHYAKEVKIPVLIHILTKKGKGYPPAEADPTKFHSAPPFDVATGEIKKKKTQKTYTSVFSKAILRLAEEDPKIIGITAAMLDGTGLEDFAKKFPERVFDVGIAEEHGITYAAGLASQGFKPVAAIYSTFLQRAYDQIIHDVCLNKFPVVFCLDRAGIVGEDGPTHNGVFDIAYLRSIPNIVVMAPKDCNELQHMIKTAVDHNGPVSIRYPRGNGVDRTLDKELKSLEIGKAEIVHKVKGDKKGVAIVAIGSMVDPSIEAAKLLEQDGMHMTVINARFAKPLDKKMIIGKAKRSRLLVTVEEGVLAGGFGSGVLELLHQEEVALPVECIGIPDEFVCHGKKEEMLKKYGLTAEGIAGKIKKILGTRE